MYTVFSKSACGSVKVKLVSYHCTANLLRLNTVSVGAAHLSCGAWSFRWFGGCKWCESELVYVWNGSLAGVTHCSACEITLHHLFLLFSVLKCLMKIFGLDFGLRQMKLGI